LTPSGLPAIFRPRSESKSHARSEPMRKCRWQLPTLTVIAALVALVPSLARAAFDMEVKVADSSSKLIKMERTGPARDFVQRAAIYLRYIPAKGTRVHPAFINTHNFL